MNLTSTRLATIMSRAFGLSSEGKTRLHRVYRNSVTKNLVESVADPHDERGTLLLDLENAAVAVILQPMADLAVDARGLREVSERLRTLNPAHGQSGIARLLDAARKNREAKLIVSLNWYAGTGQIERSIRLEIQDEEPDGEAAQILNDWKTAMIENLATLEIPTTRLLTPLLGAVA